MLKCALGTSIAETFNPSATGMIFTLDPADKDKITIDEVSASALICRAVSGTTTPFTAMAIIFPATIPVI